jgi:hypothetical protein
MGHQWWCWESVEKRAPVPLVVVRGLVVVVRWLVVVAAWLVRCPCTQAVGSLSSSTMVSTSEFPEFSAEPRSTSRVRAACEIGGRGARSIEICTTVPRFKVQGSHWSSLICDGNSPVEIRSSQNLERNAVAECRDSFQGDYGPRTR